MTERTPTRAGLLELKLERAAMDDGFRLLDDKRLMLAAEILQGLSAYRAVWRAFGETCARAAQALAEAIARHGLESLACYPAARIATARLARRERRVFGVRVLEASLAVEREPPAAPAAISPEAERCRAEFARVLEQSAALAAMSASLRRLALEYRRTERRARALEDVLIPELEQTLRTHAARLDEDEQEETAHVHRALRGI